jgi:serine/threonine protein kinase
MGVVLLRLFNGPASTYARPVSSLASPRFTPGHMVGDHFRITRFLAHGSVSEVYLAEPDRGGEPVALKILTEPTGETQANREHRIAFFLREAAVTAQLTHPNIVGVREIGYDAVAGHYIALEYLEGETLETLVEREGTFTEDRARGMASQILSALALAHRQKVLHRDLKPANIYILQAPDGTDDVKLFDFGVAKLADPNPAARELTRADDLIGTPMWMSPEQCRRRELDGRSDLYSLGAVLHYLATGQTPFIRGSLFQVLNAVLNEELRPVNEIRRSLGLVPLTRTFEKAISRALSKDPEQRFFDADHFLAFLDRDIPSLDWPTASLTSSDMSAPTRFPGVVAVRLGSDGGRPLGEAIETAMREFDEPGSYRVMERGPKAATLLLWTDEGVTVTIFETTALSLRLHHWLTEQSGFEAPMLLVGVGDPMLELPRHFHRVLAELAVDNDSGVYAFPEWFQELRAEFVIRSLGGDEHTPVEIVSSGAAPSEASDSPAGELVLEVLVGQHRGLPIADLEEVLFLAADTLEVLSAISDFQSSGSVRVDREGRATLAAYRGGRLPPSDLPPAEQRLLHLRLFSLCAARQPTDARDLTNIAENLEQAHRLSAVRHWIRAAAASSPEVAVRALYRALRLAATRPQHSAVGEIVERLLIFAQEQGDEMAAAAWLGLRERLTDAPGPM